MSWPDAHHKHSPPSPAVESPSAVKVKAKVNLTNPAKASKTYLHCQTLLMSCGIPCETPGRFPCLPMSTTSWVRMPKTCNYSKKCRMAAHRKSSFTAHQK